MAGIRIESDFEGQILKVLTAIETLDSVATEKALRMAGLDAVVLVADRVQQKGSSVSGKMRTKSKNPDGVYSKGHKKARSKANLQTGFVDLTFSGDMMRSWQLIGSDSKTADVGFISDTEGQKAEYLEAYYGEIFKLKKKEEEIVHETFDNEIENHLKSIK